MSQKPVFIAVIGMSICSSLAGALWGEFSEHTLLSFSLSCFATGNFQGLILLPQNLFLSRPANWGNLSVSIFCPWRHVWLHYIPSLEYLFPCSARIQSVHSSLFRAKMRRDQVWVASVQSSSTSSPTSQRHVHTSPWL